MANKYIFRLTIIAGSMIMLAVIIKFGYRDEPQSIIILVTALAAGSVALTLVNIYLWFKYRARR